MMLGLLLAQKGIKVTVLESHHNFDREYRGEILMPRFTQMMKQIGLWEHIEQYPNLKLKNFEFYWRDKVFATIDIASLTQEAPFAVWMPQPILLNALLDKAKTYPAFTMKFGFLVRELVKSSDGKVTGVIAEHEGNLLTINAALTVGTDGRSSTVRKDGGFEFEYEHYDFDLVWFTVQHAQHGDNTIKAFFADQYRYLILPKYPDSVQCGLVVPKGDFSKWRARGIDAMRKTLLDGHPVMHAFAQTLKDFSEFSVLQARISYVKNWAKDGCLLAGDSAHTCSPAGAIGVSVAVGTAIVAADVIVDAFQRKDFSAEALSKVQSIRAQEVKMIQQLQMRFTNIIFLRAQSMQWVTLAAMWILSRTGLMRRFQRRMMVMAKPLPVGNVGDIRPDAP